MEVIAVLIVQSGKKKQNYLLCKALKGLPGMSLLLCHPPEHPVWEGSGWGSDLVRVLLDVPVGKRLNG